MSGKAAASAWPNAEFPGLRAKGSASVYIYHLVFGRFNIINLRVQPTTGPILIIEFYVCFRQCVIQKVYVWLVSDCDRLDNRTVDYVLIQMPIVNVRSR